MEQPRKTKRKAAFARASTHWKSADPEVPFRMSGYPFYLVTRVSSRYYMKMEAVLKEIGMDVPRWRVLLILSEIGDASVSEIAAHAVSKLSTITRTVQRLETDGLVNTRPKRTDARVTEVRLTPRGQLVVDTVRPRGHQVFEQAFKGLDDAAVSKLVSLLEKIYVNVE